MGKLIGTNMFPSLVKDPFNKECIDSIRVSMGKNIFTKKAQFSAKISFVNGKTKGEQSFDGTDFKDLFAQMEIFVQSL